MSPLLSSLRAATRLATIHEILKGGTQAAWKAAYLQHTKSPTVQEAEAAVREALEILVRDNVGHAEAPTDPRYCWRPAFRRAVLGPLTFQAMRTQFEARYQRLAQNVTDDRGCPVRRLPRPRRGE